MPDPPPATAATPQADDFDDGPATGSVPELARAFSFRTANIHRLRIELERENRIRRAIGGALAALLDSPLYGGECVVDGVWYQRYPEGGAVHCHKQKPKRRPVREEGGPP